MGYKFNPFTGNLDIVSETIGDAEDGSYTDGLFTDFTSDTPIGTAIDRINEVLLGLAPPQAPALDNVSTTDSGVQGAVSFGASNNITGYTNVTTAAGGSALDINGVFVNTGGQRLGIFNASNIFNGVLNDDVVAHAYSYPADAFGPGNEGTLKLEVNGSVIHSVDLTMFLSGSTVNGNGSGFSLSLPTSVEFADGSPFTLFKYRTGTWEVRPADQRTGHNYCRVIHTTTGDVTTNYFEWVVDANGTSTTYSSLSISGLSMTGSAYLSGVQYHTGGTATYNATIANHHRNTYSTSASAITHPTQTNCTVPSLAINSAVTEATGQTLAQTITITGSSGRMLDADIAVSTATDRTVQSDLTSSTTNGGYRLLMDSNISGASGESDTAESWNAEGYRQASNLSLTSTAYASGPSNGPADWDNTISLVSATAGYSDGLLVYNGALRYPTQGANSGNFGGITNGPGGNPNYSAATGNRVYLRYFYVGSGKQNFTMNLTVSSASFVSVATGPSGNNLTCEILAPNTTQNGSGTVQFKDAVTAYTDDNSIGCFAATYGATIPTNWGITLGTRSTATSGSVVVMRITAASTWTGNISAMSFTAL